jgi:hypothetical protein
VHERAVLAQLLRDVGRLLEDSAGPAAGVPTTEADPAGMNPDLTEPGVDWAALESSLAAPPPDDPAVARLLPDAHRDDPAAAESFRRLTEQGLRERKRTGLERAATALVRDQPVKLTPDEAQALLKGLTDVRLVLAERLGLRSDEDAELLHHALRSGAPLDDEWVHAAAVYDALTWWQETLVAALTR